MIGTANSDTEDKFLLNMTKIIVQALVFHVCMIFMIACKLVIGKYKGLYNTNMWMSTAPWAISGNV